MNGQNHYKTAAKFNAYAASVFLCVAVTAVCIAINTARSKTPEPVAAVAPKDKIETRWVAFAGDANSNPPMIFGGKLFSEMDRCAAIAVRVLLFQSPNNVDSASTVAVNNFKFVKPVNVKDLVVVTATVTSIGEKSITMQATSERETKDGRELCAEAEFVFVAIDSATKKSTPHGLQGR